MVNLENFKVSSAADMIGKTLHKGDKVAYIASTGRTSTEMRIGTVEACYRLNPNIVRQEFYRITIKTPAGKIIHRDSAYESIYILSVVKVD